MDQRVMQLRAEQWKSLLEAQANSGLTKSKWCEENNVPRCQFFRWQRKLRAEALAAQQPTAASPAEPAFAELDIPSENQVISFRPAPAGCGGSSSTVRITCGRFSVEVSAGEIDVCFLSAVLKAVSHAD